MLPAPTTTRHVDAVVADLLDLGGDALDLGGIGAVLERSHQRLARELQQDALEAGLGGHRRYSLPDLEAGEARDPDVLAGLGGDLGAQLLDRLAPRASPC